RLDAGRDLAHRRAGLLGSHGGDVAARHEGAARAHQDDGLDGVVFDRLLKALVDAVAHLSRQGVHRRIVDGENRDVAFGAEVRDPAPLRGAPPPPRAARIGRSPGPGAASTASVSAPSSGGARLGPAGERENRMGLATRETLPAFGWVSSWLMPRCRTCGSAKA